MKQFYLTFKNIDALRQQLSWTHYRLLMKVEKEEIRDFYINECIQGNWSTRQLERQIDSFYYQRILASQNRELVSITCELKKRLTKQNVEDAVYQYQTDYPE